MAAKPRINMRFDGEVLAALDAEVERRKAAGARADRTALMEELCRAGLGMPSPAAGSEHEAGPEPGVGTPGAPVGRSRGGRAAASRAPVQTAAKTAKRGSGRSIRKASAAKAEDMRAAVPVAAGHRANCRCPVCKALR